MTYLKAISKETGLQLSTSLRNKFNFETKSNETTIMSEEDFKEYVYNNFVDECEFIECSSKR